VVACIHPLYSEQCRLRIFNRILIGFIAYIVCTHSHKNMWEQLYMGIFSNINSLYIYIYFRMRHDHSQLICISIIISKSLTSDFDEICINRASWPLGLCLAKCSGSSLALHCSWKRLWSVEIFDSSRLMQQLASECSDA
jgi:hypothetical protein